jgi:hypothetical protein
MLLGSVAATLHSVVGCTTLTPPHVASHTGGYLGRLSPTTAPGSLYVPSCPSSSPSSPSFILPQISSSSLIPEMPASPQPHFYNDSASVPDRQTLSATSTASLRNTDYSAALWPSAVDVHLSPPAEQSVGRSGSANLVVPPAAGSTEQWSHEARPHIPVIPPPLGFLGVQPLQNRSPVVHQPLGAYAPHDVQNVDPVITSNGLHHPGVTYYNNRTQPIQSVNFVGNQRPGESLHAWTISEIIHSCISGIPELPRIVVSAHNDAEPYSYWNESNADSVAHVVAARQSHPAQSSTMLVQCHHPPMRDWVMRDAARLFAGPMQNSSRAQFFLTRGAINF